MMIEFLFGKYEMGIISISPDVENWPLPSSQIAFSESMQSLIRSFAACHAKLVFHWPSSSISQQEGGAANCTVAPPAHCADAVSGNNRQTPKPRQIPFSNPFIISMLQFAYMNKQSWLWKKATKTARQKDSRIICHWVIRYLGLSTHFLLFPECLCFSCLAFFSWFFLVPGFFSGAGLLFRAIPSKPTRNKCTPAFDHIVNQQKTIWRSSCRKIANTFPTKQFCFAQLGPKSACP